MANCSEEGVKTYVDDRCEMLGNFSEEAQDLWDFVRCQRQNGSHYGTGGKCRKGTQVSEEEYSNWNTFAQGNYGKVSVNPEGTRVVKTLLTGKDGKKGEFGPHEVELATKMGELGHSPKIHSRSADHLEMDIAPGKPLWEGYSKGEDEPVMNAAQAKKAGEAIKSLHRLGYSHGDMHGQQFIVNGNDVKLLDYGLSQKVESNPVKVMQDLVKISNLVRWNQKELAEDPYFALVDRHIYEYREVKGRSKAAVAQRESIAESYLKGLEALK